MKFDALSIAKGILSGVVGIGTTKIVKKIISNNVTIDSPVDKVAIVATSWVLGAIVGERAKDFTNDMVDDIVENATKILDHVKHVAKLSRINRGESTFVDEGLDAADYIMDPDGKWQKKIVIEESDTTEKLEKIKS